MTTSTPLHEISITSKEEGIIQLLVGCAHWIDANPHEVDLLAVVDEAGVRVGNLRGNEKVQLRIAGGWVRDKVRLTALSFVTSHSREVEMTLKHLRDSLNEKWFNVAKVLFVRIVARGRLG